MDLNHLVSLDIETSSDDLRGSILSIAMIKMEDKSEFYREIRYDDGLFVKAEAMRVNMIDVKQLDSINGNTLKFVDKYIVNEFLGKDKQHKYVMFGAGVNYFDRQFIEKDLPKLHGHLQRAMIDLNSLLHGICLKQNKNYKDLKYKIYKFYETIISEEMREKGLVEGTELKNEEIKDFFDELKYYRPHNALYDARRNVFYLEECLKLILGQ